MITSAQQDTLEKIRERTGEEVMAANIESHTGDWVVITDQSDYRINADGTYVEDDGLS